MTAAAAGWKERWSPVKGAVNWKRSCTLPNTKWMGDGPFGSRKNKSDELHYNTLVSLSPTLSLSLSLSLSLVKMCPPCALDTPWTLSTFHILPLYLSTICSITHPPRVRTEWKRESTYYVLLLDSDVWHKMCILATSRLMWTFLSSSFQFTVRILREECEVE